MKPTTILPILLLLACTFSYAEREPKSKNKPTLERVNFYVVNKPKGLDLFSRLVIMRARKQSIVKREFVMIMARSSKEASEKILEHLEKKKAKIGTLWFDSHGRYANGYSSFILGDEEFSYRTINDSNQTSQLARLATYVDVHTKIGLGSCYSGATYEKPAHNGKPASRMNGDSLIIGMAKIFDGATVYGTEGWVMTKPGTFHAYGYALSGFPIQRKFKDEIYRPVWENLGVWNCYSTTTQKFERINSVALTRTGAIHVKSVPYLGHEKYQKRQARNLEKLEAGVIKSK